MDYTQPQFWPQLKQLAGNIDGLDYFQILNLAQTASSEQIRASYYLLARALHPDRFFHIDDEATKDAVHKIYKRVVEAYDSRCSMYAGMMSRASTMPLRGARA